MLDLVTQFSRSLSATWIRNSILLALRKSSPLPSASIRALPIDFVFNFPSIANLSAFIFGVVFMAQNSTPSSEPEAPEEADTAEQTFQWPTLGQVGQTIIKLREGSGEPPLIVIHGKLDPF